MLSTRVVTKIMGNKKHFEVKLLNNNPYLLLQLQKKINFHHLCLRYQLYFLFASNTFDNLSHKDFFRN